MSDLVNTAVLNTKVSKMENKIPDTSSLVTTNVLNKKLKRLQTKFLIILNIWLLNNLIT